MANYTGGSSAVCPFYQHESKYEITCEGINEQSVQQTKFSSEDCKDKHVRHVCSSFYYMERCPIARMLSEKYK